MKFNMHKAKSQLSRLGKLVWKGEKIVIAKEGQNWIDPDFDETPPGVWDEWFDSPGVSEDFMPFREQPTHQQRETSEISESDHL